MAKAMTKAMTGEVKADCLNQALLRLGDDCLILGHRVSQWCGHAPILEEDIAMANIALDLIGQTQLWLGLAAKISGGGQTADGLAYRRDAGAFRNLLLVEQPNGDYGRTLMRQFLFDGYHFLKLRQLEASRHDDIAAIAQKSVKEVAYHYERSRDLIIRLGDGSSTSHDKMQIALTELWPYCGEMFLTDDHDEVMAAADYAPLVDGLREAWLAMVKEVLAQAHLQLPTSNFSHKGGRQGHHSEHLGYILAEMQFLQRAYPDATW